MESGLKVWCDQLTALQHLSYRVHKAAPTHFMTNLVYQTDISGPLRPELLQKSFRIFTDRHEIFRAVFREEKERVITYLTESNSCNLEFLDLSKAGDEKSRRAKVNEILDGEKNTEEPFDLAKGPLVRATLIRLDPTKHVIVMRVHHIIWDWQTSMNALKEILNIYAALSENETPPASPASMPFNEFARETRKHHLSGAAPAALMPVFQMFKDPPVLKFKKPHPPKHTTLAGQFEQDLPEGIPERLAEKCKALRVTPFMFLLGTYYLLLHKTTGQRDILVGVAGSARTRISHQSILGPLVRGMPYRTAIDPVMAIGEFVTTFAKNAGKIFAIDFDINEPLTAEDEAKSHRASMTINEAAWFAPIPLIQFTFDFVGKTQQIFSVGALTVHHEHVVHPRQIKSDMFFIVHSEPNHISLNTMYYKEIFDEDDIRGLTRSYIKIIESVLDNPDQPIELALKGC